MSQPPSVAALGLVVVDHDDLTMRGLRFVLPETGFHLVAEAASVSAALAVLDTADWDCCLLRASTAHLASQDDLRLFLRRAGRRVLLAKDDAEAEVGALAGLRTVPAACSIEDLTDGLLAAAAGA